MNKWSLKAKILAGAISLTLIPPLIVGGLSYLAIQSLKTQLVEDRQNTQSPLTPQLSVIALISGATALFSATIALRLTRLVLRPILKASQTSTTVVNRLRQENFPLRSPETNPDALRNLPKNINLIAQQIPTLLWKREATDEQFQVLMTISRHIWESFSEENVLRTTVEEVRQTLNTDRVAIFRFDNELEGTFIAESVAPIWPKTLWTTINHALFDQNYTQMYQEGLIHAINDIYQAELSDADIGLLERFAVKASLIAPIFRENKLFGLLIAHQCANSRHWQPSEIDLFAQIAIQVGFALDHARLLAQVDHSAEQTQIFTDITLNLRKSLREEDVLTTTVEEVRKAFKADRVLVYSFDSDWYGTVIAESVVPGFPKALWAKIKDPCFAEGYVESYQQGRVHALDNIYEAGLTECYLQQLEPFGVKANLVAPILKDERLFGLLIAHQCSNPRHWQPSEIDLFAQIAIQVGFALDHARLLGQVDHSAEQTHLFSDITLNLRKSLREEDVLTTTVEEVRKAFKADRVLVYSFDSDWYGTVIAESVVPGFPKALWAKIKDPCFAEGYVESYQQGRVHALDNIYEAGLTECYLQQLEPFGVKANLVAPILKDERLFGLLIAHQCTNPRHWQPSEIELFTQIAIQVGFALDHARLLGQVEQAYQTAHLIGQKQHQQQETLHLQLSEILGENQTGLKNLSTEALTQMDRVSVIYNQIRDTANHVENQNTIIQQIESQQQQMTKMIQSSCESMNQLLEQISTFQNTFIQTADQLNLIEQPVRKLFDVISLVNNIMPQVKFEALSAELEVSRIEGGNGQLSSMIKKALSLTAQMETEFNQIVPLIGEIQGQTHEVSTTIRREIQQIKIDNHLVEEIKLLSGQIIRFNGQITDLVKEIAQVRIEDGDTLAQVSHSVLEMATFIRQTSEQTRLLVNSFDKIAEIIEQHE
ncbi:methyl-accepting chemotaxis sensory transducer [Gloeothece citriformis PCC 7424]|uniref:Methyl-accepting chemotaxis sensory transducer n=1 Tax=Gloeothece citriformis (strain PCC 7424) TaxID=65393 RepID=B7KL94_GLOC7|nr:GAF domain-containing protein [Gloeothece citriformis]ACK72466.1 methyl-accepting chemotaxis sensory transducer [Gloeothece citriformis PCC 7424]